MKRVLGPGATCECDGCCELCCPDESTADVFAVIAEEPEEFSEEDE